MGKTRVVVAMSGILVFLSDNLLAECWQAGGGDLVLLVAAVFFSYYTVSAKSFITRIVWMTVMFATTRPPTTASVLKPF